MRVRPFLFSSSSVPSENELPSYDSVEEKASAFISLTSDFKAVITRKKNHLFSTLVKVLELEQLDDLKK